MKMKIKDFPKLLSPFVRKMIDGNYIVTNEITEGMEWVFEDESVMAIEKLHGCLHSSQTILTDKGYLGVGKIVNRKLPVKVASYNFDKQIIEFKKIEHYHKAKRKNNMICVIVQSRNHGLKPKNIVCTINHKFYSKGKWIEAKNLKNGQEISHITNVVSEEVKQIILGGLLGDSSIQQNRGFSSKGFSFCHSVKQKDYFNFKKTLLGNLFNQHKSSISGFSNKKLLRGGSVMCPSISDFITNHCMINNKKRVTKKWVDRMNPFAIAIWYMDDGSCNFPKTQRGRAVFSCNSYDKEEAKILSEKLLNFGIENKLFFRKNKKDGLKEYSNLELSANGTERLFDIILPYIPKSMKYKIHSKYKDYPCIFENTTFKQSLGLVKTKVLNVTKKLPKKCSGGIQPDYEYDIRVKDNSNYFTNQILVHNTNVSIVIQEGTVTQVYNRTERIPFITKSKKWIIEGLLNSKERGYLEFLGDGQFFGELIGEKVNGNPYKIEGHLWIPFDGFAQKHLKYKCWGKYPKTFESLSEWFKELMPLYTSMKGNRDGFVEGIVFTHLDTGQMAKLRRDMFSWYKEERHKGGKNEKDI